MHRNKTIQSIAAGLMLLLFAVSITPKQLLHDVITRHKHSYTDSTGGINLQTASKNFNCNWHNQVVESPFTYQPGFQFAPPVIAFASHINLYTDGYYSAETAFTSLRGPPSLI